MTLLQKYHELQKESYTLIERQVQKHTVMDLKAMAVLHGHTQFWELVAMLPDCEVPLKDGNTCTMVIHRVGLAMDGEITVQGILLHMKAACEPHERPLEDLSYEEQIFLADYLDKVFGAV